MRVPWTAEFQPVHSKRDQPSVFFGRITILLYFKAKPSLVVVTQLHPTLCNPMDCSLPDSSIPGILQGRILEWVAISFSKDRKSVV